MKITTILAALLFASAASAGGFSGGGVTSGAFSASGFASGPTVGNWSVGAMNESYGFASANPACTKCGTGVEISTSGGSVTEGFGSGRFGGVVGAGGAGFGEGRGGFTRFGR